MIINDTNEGRWERIDGEYLFRRPWLTVRRDRVRLPDGRINPEFYVLEYPSWVNVIAITADGLYVMERQYRYGLGETRYELPAGVVEEGEEPLDAAKRELAEETGYTGGDWSLVCTTTGNASTTSNLTYSYIARGVVKTQGQHLDATEELSVHLLTRDEVLSLLKEDQIRQALMAAPLWKHFAESLLSGQNR